MVRKRALPTPDPGESTLEPSQDTNLPSVLRGAAHSLSRSKESRKKCAGICDDSECLRRENWRLRKAVLSSLGNTPCGALLENLHVPSTQSAHNIGRQESWLLTNQRSQPTGTGGLGRFKNSYPPYRPPECNRRSQPPWPAPVLLAVKLRYFVSCPL